MKTPDHIKDLIGSQHIEKYPQPFIDWICEDDSWAYTFIHKYEITKLSYLFDMWVNETY